MDSVVATVRGERGLQARADKRERLNEATAYVVKKCKEAKAVGQKIDIITLGADAALQYPDVAIELPRHLKNLGKQLGIERLEDL